MKISKFPVTSSSTGTEYVVGIQQAKSSMRNVYEIMIGIKKRTKFIKKEYWEILHESEYLVENHDFITAATEVVHEYEKNLSNEQKRESYINSQIEEFIKWDGRVE